MSDVNLERYDFVPNAKGSFDPEYVGVIHDLPELTPTEDVVAAKIEEFGKTYKVEHLADGQPIGIGILNEGSLDNAKLVVTTHNSKNEQNAGHVWEMCVQAAVNLGQAIISVDSPRRLSISEIKHLRRDGIFTYWDSEERKVKGLPTFEGIGKLLSKLGYAPKYISGNHTAAHFESGIAMGLPKNTVEHIYANGLHIAKGVSHVGGEEIEDVRGKAIRRLNTEPDQWAPTPNRRKQVKKALPSIYGGVDYGLRMAGLWLHSTVYDLGVYRPAVSKNDDLDMSFRATTLDAISVLKQHNDAMITAQFNKGDKNQSLEDVLLFGQTVMDFVGDSAIRVILAEGSRDEHTNHPEIRWEAEQWAFAHHRM